MVCNRATAVAKGLVMLGKNRDFVVERRSGLSYGFDQKEEYHRVLHGLEEDANPQPDDVEPSLWNVESILWIVERVGLDHFYLCKSSGFFNLVHRPSLSA
jgi:hypothetical protein